MPYDRTQHVWICTAEDPWNLKRGPYVRHEEADFLERDETYEQHSDYGQANWYKCRNCGKVFCLIEEDND
jgi:hypothetical protein